MSSYQVAPVFPLDRDRAGCHGRYHYDCGELRPVYAHVVFLDESKLLEVPAKAMSMTLADKSGDPPLTRFAQDP